MSQAKGLPGFVLTLLILIGVLGFLVSRDEAPKRPLVEGPPPSSVSTQQVPGADPQKYMQHVRQLAQQTKGEWTRLSQQDQRLLDSYTGGHGRAMFAMMAQQAQPASNPSRSRKQ